MRTVVFAAVALAVYGAMHMGFYLRVRVLLPAEVRIVLAGFMVLLLFCPFAAMLFSSSGLNATAAAAAVPGYLWMGFLFLAVCAGLAVRAWDLAAISLDRMVSLGIPRADPRSAAFFVLGAALFGSVWGLVENRLLFTTTVTVPTRLLAPGEKPLVAAYISDLHLGPTNRPELTRRVAEKVRQARPDVILCGGDLVDTHAPDLLQSAEILRGLSAPLGKYAVLGNHEAYYGVEQAEAYLRSCGFTLLGGKTASPGNLLFLVGVDDPATGRPDRSGELLSVPGAKGRLPLVLRHRPQVPKASAERFALQLSGHTHGGQILPFHLAVALFYPRLAGRYETPWGGAVVTCRGTGSWGPPMRILSPREVLVVRFVPEKAAMEPLAEETLLPGQKEPMVNQRESLEKTA
ncbi:MAG: metallophosphoesterase [Deltaproteobacteria bacterium]|nr:metallophosphoesterase [Deltaproteobacteria bacterium]